MQLNYIYSASSLSNQSYLELQSGKMSFLNAAVTFSLVSSLVPLSSLHPSLLCVKKVTPWNFELPFLSFSESFF